MAMTTGEKGPPLRRPDAFHNHEATQDDQRQRTNQHHPQQRHRPGEVLAAPALGPPKRDKGYGETRNGEGGEIDARPQANARSVSRWCSYLVLFGFGPPAWS